jgi:hypothetical protein
MATPACRAIAQLVGHNRRATAADRQTPRRITQPSTKCSGDVGRGPPIGRARAIAETGLADETFSEACPFTPDEVLSRAFLPEG